MNTKTVYSRKVAVELRKKGFEIIETVVNEHKPQFDAYIFEETPEFKTAFTKILSSSKNR